MITNIHHVAILTSNIDEAIKFYIDFLNCDKPKVISVEKKGMKFKSSMLPIGDGKTCLQILEPAEGKGVEELCKNGEGVLARFGRNNGNFEMVITKCTVFEPSPEDIKKRKEESGIPFWPHAFVRVHCEVDVLLENWKNEYACLGYGSRLYDDLIAFCEIMDINVILP